MDARGEWTPDEGPRRCSFSGVISGHPPPPLQTRRRSRIVVIQVREDGGTGRRGGLRIHWLTLWGFESPSSHRRISNACTVDDSAAVQKVGADDDRADLAQTRGNPFTVGAEGLLRREVASVVLSSRSSRGLISGRESRCDDHILHRVVVVALRFHRRRSGCSGCSLRSPPARAR